MVVGSMTLELIRTNRTVVIITTSHSKSLLNTVLNWAGIDNPAPLGIS
jgi:hypothetical protein